MANIQDPSSHLANARIADDIFQLRPDYRALLMMVTNIPPGPCDATSEAFLSSAEALARAALVKTPVNDVAHVAQWKEAYKAFGAKPKKTLNSLEALGLEAMLENCIKRRDIEFALHFECIGSSPQM